MDGQYSIRFIPMIKLNLDSIDALTIPKDRWRVVSHCTRFRIETYIWGEAWKNTNSKTWPTVGLVRLMIEVAAKSEMYDNIKKE